MSRKGADAHLLLKRFGAERSIVAHSEAVEAIAMAVARRIAARGRKVRLSLVHDGALLHDFGRTRTHGLRHGPVGERMLLRAGVPADVARFAKTHVLAGLDDETAPKSLEEKIVCYADKLSDGRKMGRIKTRLGAKNPSYLRILRLMREVEKMAGGKLMKKQDFDAMAILEKGGKFLVLKRRRPLVWEFPGGAIEWGETSEEAARRECEEECGLKIKVGKLLGATSAVYEKEGWLKHAVYFVFKGRLVGGKLKLSGEHSVAKWVGKKELLKLELGHNSRLALGLL